MTLNAHVDAWVALLNAGGAHAYRPSDLPDVLPRNYTEVHVMGGPRRNDRAGSAGAVLPYRLILRCVGSDDFNANVERDKAHAAVDEKTITVGAEVSTELRRETDDDPMTPDGTSSDTTWSGTSAWRYCL